jgi:glycosyltransferase involved in cell wall biosynthesis
MTHVAFIAGTYEPQHCGVAHYTAHLRTALAERGIQSTVLTTYAAARSGDNAADQTVQGAVSQWRLSDLLVLVQTIHRTQADLLHIQHAAGTYSFNRAIFLLPLLLRLSGWQAPIVTTVHEYGWWEWQPGFIPTRLLEGLKQWGQQQGWWDREDGFLLTRSNAIITTNSDAEQVLYRRLPHLKPIIHRIPIAANIDTLALGCQQPQSLNQPEMRREIRQTIHQTVRQQLGWDDETQIIAFFSFLHPVKGIETLLTAFSQVLANQPQARLLLIGGVESLALPAEQAARYWERLQTQISSLNLTETVYMTGYIDAEQVSHYLNAADIGVLPFNPGVTLKSGSLLAMMNHALPIVATRAEPPDPELTDSLLKLVPPRNPVQLAAALTELLQDSTQRQRLATAAVAYSQRFNWNGIAEAHLRIYQRLVY